MPAALIFIVKTLFELYILTFLLRFLLQWVRADFHNPLSQAIVRITNPLVVPFRRIIPGIGGQDLATLVVLVLLEIVATSGLIWLTGQSLDPVSVLYLSFLRLIVLVIRTYQFAIFVYVLLSWISPGAYNPVTSVLSSLVAPVLNPVRRVVPSIGGLDLSPLLVLVGLQALYIAMAPPGWLA